MINSVLLGIVALGSLFLQVLTVNEMSLVNYTPNIILPILVYSQFYINSRYHITLFFIIGLMLDCSNPLLFGTFTFSFIAVSYLVTLIRNNLDLQILFNRLVLIVATNALLYLIYNLMFSIYYHQSVFTFFLSFGLGIIINTLLSIVIIIVLDFIRLLKLDLTND